MLRKGEKLRMSQGRGYRGNLCTSLSILLASKSALKKKSAGQCESEKVTQSCLTLCDPMDYTAHQLLCPWNFLGKNSGVGCHSLLQGIFLIQGSNPCPASFIVCLSF